MDTLQQLSGSFLRIPGGNNLEGSEQLSIFYLVRALLTLDTDGLNQASPRFIWNETIGPLRDRPGRPGTWGYYNTDGMGVHEYMNWCVDLDAVPVWAVWSGLYLDGEIVPQAQLGPYVTEALNVIEYITGNVSTPMGALRAANGQAAPWKLKYVEIGNEDNLNNGGS